MKKQIIIVAALITLTSCKSLFIGESYPYYKIKQNDLEIIRFDSLNDCPCKLFKATDELDVTDAFGLKISLLKEYYRLAEDSSIIYGSEYNPGSLGSLEKIVSIDAYLLNSQTNKKVNITSDLYCNQTYLDNSENRWYNYPEDNKMISCYYLDDENNYRIYYTYKLNNTKPYFSQSEKGIYFSRITNDSSYLCGWDLQSDSNAFSNRGFFSDLEDFKNKFNSNNISYSGSNEINIILFTGKQFSLEEFDQFYIRIEFDNKSTIELKRNYKLLPTKPKLH